MTALEQSPTVREWIVNLFRKRAKYDDIYYPLFLEYKARDRLFAGWAGNDTQTPLGEIRTWLEENDIRLVRRKLVRHESWLTYELCYPNNAARVACKLRWGG